MEKDMQAIKVRKKQPNSKMCFVCGLENNSGLKASFFELENDELLGIFKPTADHQGYPGRLHGGIAATILDETIGRAIMIHHTDSVWGVTLEFSMKLRKPIPLDEDVRVITRVTKEKKRIFEGTGEIILADNTVAVEGTGRYMKLDIEKIADFDVEEQQWRVQKMKEDLESVQL